MFSSLYPQLKWESFIVYFQVSHLFVCRCLLTVLPWTVDGRLTWWSSSLLLIVPTAVQGAPPARVLLCCPCTVLTYSHISPAVLTVVWALQVPVVLVPVQILQQLHLSLQGKLIWCDCPQTLQLRVKWTTDPHNKHTQMAYHPLGVSSWQKLQEST